ncbi:hypothetical protein [Vibrio tritonius]|uniref:hypothetical protein n=1 Tax=Vibrio tritonius TaxID=1435069 RepID=UPI00315D2453
MPSYKPLLTTILFFFVSINSFPAYAGEVVRMQFSDGRSDVVGIDNVNTVLRVVGVRASQVDIPKEAKSVLKAINGRTFTDEEKSQLLKIFSLNRAQLLDQVRLAGREPAYPRGGYLEIEAVDAGTYPNVNDLKTLSPSIRSMVNQRFGLLHVNTWDDGTGIDETMTVIAGGPFTWFFVLPDGVVSKVTAEVVEPTGKAFRISYPGLVIHGGFMPEDGVAIGIAHGPKKFRIRYEEPSVPNARLLGTNPGLITVERYLT